MTDAEKLAVLVAALTDTTYACPMLDCQQRVTLGFKTTYFWDGSPYHDSLCAYGCSEHDKHINEGYKYNYTPGPEPLDHLEDQYNERKRLADLIGIELDLPRFADTE